MQSPWFLKALPSLLVTFLQPSLLQAFLSAGVVGSGSGASITSVNTHTSFVPCTSTKSLLPPYIVSRFDEAAYPTKANWRATGIVPDGSSWIHSAVPEPLAPESVHASLGPPAVPPMKA